MDYTDINSMLKNLDNPDKYPDNTSKKNNSMLERDLLLNNNKAINFQLVDPQRDLIYRKPQETNNLNNNKKIENYRFEQKMSYQPTETNNKFTSMQYNFNNSNNSNTKYSNSYIDNWDKEFSK